MNFNTKKYKNKSKIPKNRKNVFFCQNYRKIENLVENLHSIINSRPSKLYFIQNKDNINNTNQLF